MYLALNSLDSCSVGRRPYHISTASSLYSHCFWLYLDRSSDSSPDRLPSVYPHL